MNVLILNWRDPTNPKSGGAEVVTMEHAKAWVTAGCTVTWFTSSFPYSKKEEVIHGVKIVRQGSALSVFVFAFFYYIFHVKKVDVIVDEVHGIPFFSVLYSNKPIVVFIHEVAGVIWNVMYPAPIAWIGKRLERLYLWLYRKNYFWTDAESTRQELISFGVSPDRSIAIPCPIHTIPLAELPKKETKPTYIFVGRLVKMKRIEDILRAFFLIAQTQPNAQLWLVGPGHAQYIHKLQTMAAQYKLQNHITFFGYVTEQKKLTLMERAHIFLHTSYKEGWGLVVLEAASRATPSVVYNVAGLRDTVKHEKTGLIIQSNTPRELARVALSLYGDRIQYATFQRHCLRFAQYYQWKKVANMSLNLLKNIV